MSKSILIIDTPKHCGDDCILCQLDGVYVCRQTRQILNKDINEKTINRYCPLKHMPQKKEVDVKKIEDIMHTEFQMVDVIQDKIEAKIKLDTDKLIALGYNTCINEILGE